MFISFLIEHFSYKILFFWSILEGEIGLALAGFMVQEGKFDFLTVLTLAVSGALIGDVTVFLLGRLFRKKAESLLASYAERLKRIESWFRRFGNRIVVFERFIYGTHIPALLMLGVSGFGFLRFLLLDILGVILWAVAFTSLGYFFGHTVIDLLALVQRHLTIILLVVLFFYFVYLLQREEKEEGA